MSDYGIDVSVHNSITNWAAIRSGGNSWAWSKATQGAGYTNASFASQFAGSRAAGLVTGAYHFPDPNVSVAANVNHFVAVARPAGAFAAGALLPMLDVEDDPPDGIVWTAASANAFIPAFRDQLRAVTGQLPLCVYAPQSWWASGMLRPDDWADDHVFLCAARYGVAPGVVGWSHRRLAIHQYTDAAANPGATRPTDRSVTVGGFTVAALTIGGRATTPKEDDDMWKFLVDNASLQTNGSYTRCAELLPTAELIGTDWADISAKVAESKNGGPPASVRGVETGVFDDYEKNSNAHKAAVLALGKLTAIGGVPTAPTAFDISIAGTATPKEQ